MKTAQIRQTFLDYFAAHDHQVVPSSPLVPANDATLLFTNSGMVQFKDVFLGIDTRPYTRAVTAQRCVRAGGKHNDLENVGYTARHHTFFEMLGNFSFGDYFKHDAIRFAWELLVQGFGLSPDKLWVTVYEEDEAAATIWRDEIGVAAERVIKIGAQDNFWQMGDTGPCGPCSEIFYDHGVQVAGGPPGSATADGDRFVEVWNLVFMQFNRNADASLDPLPQPSVDTGLGLERMAAVLQGVTNNYEIDLFQNLIGATAKILNVADKNSQSLRVITDHIRSSVFMLVDGVIPSNEGRGYVLRRIIRRAIRHGYQAGCKRAFMHHLVAPLLDEMGSAFPELGEAESVVTRILQQENEKFNETLEQGLKILTNEIAQLSDTILSGEVAFKLYDTYGFPLDLSADVAREQGVTIDQQGFDTAMQAQQQRARATNQFIAQQSIPLRGLPATRFVGYEQLQHEVTALRLGQTGQVVAQLKCGAEDAVIVVDATPFYAEGGGQVGDHGTLCFATGTFQVTDTRHLSRQIIGHFGTVISGSIACDARGQAEVVAATRVAHANNHSATHLLHAALRQVLGQHVAQKGSLIEARRLRFDFSHAQPLTAEELQQITLLVNQEIRANHPLEVATMSLNKAKAAGAVALFGEQYPKQVRTIKMGDFSFELCGGTHVNRSGDIGYFAITAESGVAAGIRRLEACSGTYAEQHSQQQGQLLGQAAMRLHTTPAQLDAQLATLVAKQKSQQQQIDRLRAQLAQREASVREINGIKVVVQRQDEVDDKSLRRVLDAARCEVASGVVLVVGVKQAKVTLLAGISEDLQAKLSAGQLMATIAPLVGGRGGGKAAFAQGGGDEVTGLERAIAAAYQWVAQASDSEG